MKQFKTFVIAAVLTMGMVQMANAQKVAHINFEEVVANMPETLKLQAELEKLEKTYGDEITNLQKALKAKVDKYYAEEVSKTAAQNEELAKEIQEDQGKIQQLQLGAQQELQQKQNAALDPIIKKAQEAIKAVAKEKGIVYVLDAKALIVLEGEDLLPAVKISLGIQ